MKKSISLGWGLIAMVIGSCGNQSTTNSKEHAGASTAAQGFEPVLFFKAVGNEPGWYIQMTAADDGSFPVLMVLDYGADTLRGVVRKGPIMEPTSDGKGRPTVGTNETRYNGSLDESDGGQTIEVFIQSGICTDDADKQHGASVVVKLSDQSLRGCGDYFE